MTKDQEYQLVLTRLISELATAGIIIMPASKDGKEQRANFETASKVWWRILNYEIPLHALEKTVYDAVRATEGVRGFEARHVLKHWRQSQHEREERERIQKLTGRTCPLCKGNKRIHVYNPDLEESVERPCPFCVAKS